MAGKSKPSMEAPRRMAAKKEFQKEALTKAVLTRKGLQVVMGVSSLVAVGMGCMKVLTAVVVVLLHEKSSTPQGKRKGNTMNKEVVQEDILV